VSFHGGYYRELNVETLSACTMHKTCSLIKVKKNIYFALLACILNESYRHLLVNIARNHGPGMIHSIFFAICMHAYLVEITVYCMACMVSTVNSELYITRRNISVY
jgi:hypothetical protein